MSPRTFVIRGAALFALGLGIAACETKTIVQQPPADVVVTVSPSTANLTKAGATVQYVALVTGVGANGNTAVTWKSSNTGVATVAASGNTATVTAVASGTASIIATSVQDPTRSGAATVTVAIDTSKVPVGTPSVSIQSITDAAGAPANTQDIRGLINVTLNVDVPQGVQVSSVNWLIDGKTVCSQTFSSGKSAGGVTVQSTDAVTMTCQINTAQLTSGLPTFANGTHTLSATLVGPTGTTQASTSQALVFNNQNDVSASVTTTKTAIGPGGIVWNGGNLSITAVPVIFTGSPVARVTFALVSKTSAATLATIVDSTATDGFTATFRGDSATYPLTGITDSVYVTMSTVTAAGTQGPTPANTKPYWFDNQAPTKVLFFLNKSGKAAFSWINGAFAFSSAIDTTQKVDCSTTPCTVSANTGPVDKGVDRVTYTFSAGPTRDSLSAASTGNDLAESTAATRYTAKVVIADALGNSTSVYASVTTAGDTAQRFGVDKQAPVVVFDAANTVADTAKFKTNPTTAQYVIGFQDLGASGFATAAPLQITEVADTGGGKVCVVGTKTSAFCDTPASYPSQVPVDGTAGTQQGYITVTAYVVDRAFNKSNTLSRSVLVDYTLPVADSVVVTTSPLAGGASETFQAFVTDNVSLASATAQVQYNGVFGALPMLKDLGKVSYSGYGSFTKTSTANFTDPFFFRAIETSVGGGWILPLQVDVTPKDVAGNTGLIYGFPGAVTGFTAPTSDPFAGVTTLAQTADTTTQTLQAKLTLPGTAATVSPAAQVQFYLVDTTTGVATLIGTATNPVITVNGTAATFTYQTTSTKTLNTKLLTGPPAMAVFAAYASSGGIAVVQPVTILP